MKRDVTRGGKRTQRGAVDDAVAGARRFFENNVRDSHRQLGVDLLLGLVPLRALKARGVGGSGTSGNDSALVSGRSVPVRRLLRQYAPWSNRLASIRRLLSSSILNPPHASTASLSNSTASAANSTTGAINREIPRKAPRVRGKTAAVVNNSPSEVEVAADAPTCPSQCLAVGDEALLAQSGKLDILLSDWLHGISSR